MNRNSWRVLLCALLSPAVLGAQLVKDINSTTELAGSYPQYSAVDVGSLPVDVALGKLLVMNDGRHGDELWITDGTPAGTRMVRDISPGADASYIQGFTLMGGVAYFWADDGVNGTELWRSDGTTAGTRIVVNIGAGQTGAGGDYLPGRALVAAGGVLYFAARDTAGSELWRSDGTANGTYRVRDINPGDSESQIQQILVSGSRIFFGATDAQGFEPWTSDGTEAGTVRIADIRVGAEGSAAWFYAAAGGAVFFAATDGARGNELWRVGDNGTGAAIVADINTTVDGAGPATLGSKPKGVFAVGNRVVFTAVTGGGAGETNNLYSAGATGGVTMLAAAPADAEPTYVLSIGTRASFRLEGNLNATLPYWVTDGTAAGTAQLNIPRGNSVFYGEGVHTYGNAEAFFCAPASFGGTDIWRTDGTVAGTRLYLQAQGSSFSIASLTYFGGRVYYPYADYGVTGGELWSTDGTTAGTRLLLDIYPGAEHAAPWPFGVFGGRLLFFANDGVTGFEPWSTDGTVPGTARIGNFSPEIRTGSSYPTMLGVLGGDVLFSADNDTNGEELWASDGTAVGTRLIKDVYPGNFGSRISGAYRLGNVLLFGAEDPVAGSEVWRTDGTTAGTYRVTDIYPGATSGLPDGWLSGVTLNGYLYFIGQDANNYRDLWRTDGTPGGTSMVANIGSGFDSVEVIGATASRVILVWRPASTQSDGVVWSTDGTAAGTFAVANNILVYSAQSALYNGRVCLAARETVNQEIYCTNGSPGDMVRITDLASLNVQASGMPHVVNGTLLVPGYSTTVGQAVFATDGTPASTRQFSSGTTMNLPDTPFGGGIVYQGYDNGTVTIMYTDGTPGGTRPFLPAGTPAVAMTNYPFTFAGSIIFVASDPNQGPVLWRSDGTPAGTRYLTDIDPGTDGSAPPADFLESNGKLFFAGSRAGIGRELWTLSPLDPNASDDWLDTANATMGVAAVLANDADFDGMLNPSSVEIVTPPASGTATIDNITGAIRYTPGAGFSGADVLVYRVADTSGRLSNPAYLSIVVASPAGAGAGTAPVPTPTPTPTPVPPTNPPSSGGGGGGAFGVDLLLLALLLAPRVRRLRRVATR